MTVAISQRPSQGRRDAAIAGLASKLIDVPFAEAIAAFAPGGLEAMTMMAFVLGLDPLFVGSHHFARFLLISVGLPIVTRRMRKG